MKGTFAPRLLEREVSAATTRNTTYRTLYSDRQLISELDIVNELDGHSGCVNALSWSKSGNLLASGSDDQHLNIHTYQPQDTHKQFQLGCTVATGHTQNIFSVKFMPHSNDRTVITAAGDSEVRIFDLEYSGQTREASAASSLASEGRRRGRNNVFNGVRYLSDGDTDCRVYRSHGDRVKRIVTESSPHLFLTCSEDGEVRQWDLRQPSSTYPSPRGRNNNVPPPLISYKRYNLDLNTISCSASQPHYIALGGAHLHCFLHDRRMIGRDRLAEAGASSSPASHMSADQEELMGQATRCVRKFAPRGQKRMRKTDNGHITACKISDARPDEMVVSWSGEHIHSFDLIRSPDATEEDTISGLHDSSGSRVKESKDRKRKRRAHGSEASLAQDAAARASSRQRTEETEDGQGTALRIRYQNGQQEDIPLNVQGHDSRMGATPLTAKQREARRIAEATVKIRSSLFGIEDEDQNPTIRFTTAIGHCASIIEDMEQVMREWGYPLNPTAEEVVVRQTLRRNRDSARNFVQAAGTLARALGGRLQTTSGASPLLASFSQVDPKSVDPSMLRTEEFGYNFLKAILLWTDSGIGSLIEGFTCPTSMPTTSKGANRLPVPESEATPEAIDEFLIPYLLRLAGDRPIINVESNRFETDESRQLFPTEKAAVLAFAATVKIPFADLSSAVVLSESTERIQAQDRRTAIKHWVSKVARGVLLNAAEGVNYTFVDRAFGGLGRVVREVAAEREEMEQTSEEDEEAVYDVEVIDENDTEEEGIAYASAEDISAALMEQHDSEEEEDNESGDDVGDDDSEDDEDDDDDSSDPDEEDGVPNLGLPRFASRSAFDRRQMRDLVEASVPCSPHTRVYRGHCNVKTVKDVNFFGLDDEYVVSGSDDGNFFIWDRKTSELVNILEGDGEVVNVVQGHPYEPMLAVSGIDHTIKIFSPDTRARNIARLGQGIHASDPSGFSSLAWPPRLGRRRVGRHSESRHADAPTSTSEPAVPTSDAGEPEEDDDFVAPGGLTSRRKMHEAYSIMSQNDVERQGGNQDAFITRAMLAQLAQRLRVQRAARAAGQDVGGDAGGVDIEETGDDDLPVRIMLGENCGVQ